MESRSFDGRSIVVTVELDDFDLFMCKYSLEFRRVLDQYLDAETIDGKIPPDSVIIDRARTMQSFIDYILEKRQAKERAS